MKAFTVPGHGPILSPKERPAKCEKCQAAFTQFELSAYWAEIPSVKAQLPDGWTPKYCPPCERREIPSDEDLAQRRGPRRATYGEPIYDRADRDYEQAEREGMQAADTALNTA